MSDGDAMAERVWLGAQNRSKVSPVLVYDVTRTAVCSVYFGSSGYPMMHAVRARLTSNSVTLKPTINVQEEKRPRFRATLA